MFFLRPTRDIFLADLWGYIFYNVEWVEFRKMSKVFWVKLNCKRSDFFEWFFLRFSTRNIWNLHDITEALVRRCSVKKVVLKIFTTFIKKHLCWSFVLVCNLIKMRLQHKCFSVNFAKFLRTISLKKTSEPLSLILQCFSFHFILFNRDLNRGCLVYMFPLRLSGVTMVRK